MFALAADGKTNRKGMPNPLRLAVIANAHFDTVRLPFPPALVQRLGLALGAPLGRAARLRGRLCPRPARGRCGRRLDLMRRRLFFALLIAALVALAALGLVLRVGRPAEAY